MAKPLTLDLLPDNLKGLLILRAARMVEAAAKGLDPHKH